MKIPGVTFSWKRALGVTKVKQKTLAQMVTGLYMLEQRLVIFKTVLPCSKGGNMDPDFVATELLRELKQESANKSKRIKRLRLALLAMAVTSSVTLLGLVSVIIKH